MKTCRFKTVMTLLVVMTLLAGCTKKGTDEECEETKMDLQEPVIYLKLTTSAHTIPEDHFFYEATKIVLSGTITKIYCSGKISTSFDYNTEFLPNPGIEKLYYLADGVYCPQPYQFKFENKLDYLSVICRLDVYFADGKIYESNDYANKYYYSNVKLDPNTFERFISITFPSDINFFDVTYGP